MEKNIVSRMGLFPSTVLFTLIAVFVSVFVTIIIYLISDKDIMLKIFLIPIVTPLIIAPPMIIFYGRLLIKVSVIENQMRMKATHDQLTNLLNRYGFFELANVIYDLSIRNKMPFSILYCDIDHFKKINDEFGHEAGDLVLLEISKNIQKKKRKSDLVARFGGEEFLLILPETNRHNALLFATKIKEEISKLEIRYNNEIITVTISIGISDNSDNIGRSLDRLISTADKALYKSKQNGRNCITVYE